MIRAALDTNVIISALLPTVAIRLSLATQPPSASRLCPYAAANTTNDKDLMRWAAGEAERSRK